MTPIVIGDLESETETETEINERKEKEEGKKQWKSSERSKRRPTAAEGTATSRQLIGSHCNSHRKRKKNEAKERKSSFCSSDA